MAPPPPRASSRGELAQAVAVGAAKSREPSPVRAEPDLMGAAARADEGLSSRYESPKTAEKLAPTEPAKTRSGAAVKLQLENRLQTRAQARVSKAEQRAWATQRQQISRARRKDEATFCAEVMVELARYDLPLVQLLMAEFALQPCNYDARSGAMRYHFLVQYD